jgi:hypothetical protein
MDNKLTADAAYGGYLEEDTIGKHYTLKLVRHASSHSMSKRLLATIFRLHRDLFDSQAALASPPASSTTKLPAGRVDQGRSHVFMKQSLG